MKKAFISNGIPVEVLTEFQVEGKTKYFVRELFDPGEGYYADDPDEPEESWGTEYVVDKVYDEVETTPTHLRRSKLQAEIDELEAQKLRAVDEARQAKADHERDPGFDPKFKLGETVYAVSSWHGTVEKNKIKSIKFTKSFAWRDPSKVEATYEYMIDKEYGSTFSGDSVKYLFHTEDDAKACAAPILEKKAAEKQAEDKKRLEAAKKVIAELES